MGELGVVDGAIDRGRLDTDEKADLQNGFHSQGGTGFSTATHFTNLSLRFEIK
jgi:hypothetical protein